MNLPDPVTELKEGNLQVREGTTSLLRTLEKHYIVMFYTALPQKEIEPLLEPLAEMLDFPFLPTQTLFTDAFARPPNSLVIETDL